MTQTRTEDRNRTASADMREDGMPAGQAPARQERRAETAVQRAEREARDFRDKLVAEVQHQRPMIQNFLNAYGVDWDFFVTAMQVGLANTMKNDREFFDPNNGVTVGSFIEAVVRCAKDGLVPDGKQAAIVRFKRAASYMPMIEGFCHILYATGLVKDINHNVVRDGDEIEYAEGDNGYVNHRRPFRRVENAETIGAWCVINLHGGGKIVEICDDKDLRDIAKVSRATKGPRIDWADEMHRKGPFRRAIKRAPKNQRLQQVLEHDDANYDLSPAAAAAAAAAAPVPKGVFGNRAARRPPPAETLVVEDRRDTDETMDAVVEETGPTLTEVVASMLQAESLTDLLELKGQAEALATDDEGRAWIDETVAKRRAELMPADEDDDHSGDATEKVEDDGPALVAELTSGQPPKVYEDADLWKSDILTKLAACNAAQKPAFWKKNLPHVLTAGERGHDKQAEKILEVARSHGLRTEVDDGQ